MDPKSNEVIWLLDLLLFCRKKTLEYIGQMSAVELVMEVLSSLFKASINFGVKRKCGFDDWTDFSLDSSLEFSEMSRKIGGINDR
jgi:hypothetical protein